MEKLQLKLKRIARRPNYTIGRLYADGKYVCDTLEDTEREGMTKIPGKTAIPKGNYKVIVSYSCKFKKEMPLLLKVPNFEGIRIHSGNDETHTEGCILCGENKVVGKVVNSRVVTDKVYKIINEAINKGKEVWIEVR
jgi:hypothetical protein